MASAAGIESPDRAIEAGTGKNKGAGSSYHTQQWQGGIDVQVDNLWRFVNRFSRPPCNDRRRHL